MKHTTRIARNHRVIGTIALAATATAAGIALSLAGNAQAAPAASHNVPWNKVGAGWTVALTAQPSQQWTTYSQVKETLDLVGPGGHVYPVAHLTGKQLIAASPNGRKILISALGSDGAAPKTLINLRTGQRSTPKLPNTLNGPIAFSRDGSSLIAAVQPLSGAPEHLERFGLGGHLEASLPASVPGAGAINSTWGFVALPGGRIAVGAKHGVVVLRANGSVAERLAGGRQDCAVSSQPKPGVVLAECGASGGKLVRVPLSGARPRLLGSDKDGYTAAWQVGNQTLLGGTAGLARVGANGTVQPVALRTPAGMTSDVAYVSHHGNKVVLEWETKSGNAALFSYNLTSHTSRAVLPPNGATVVNSAIAINE